MNCRVIDYLQYPFVVAFAIIFGLMLNVCMDTPTMVNPDNTLASYVYIFLLLICGCRFVSEGWKFIQLNKVDIAIAILSIIIAIEAHVWQDVGPKYDNYLSSLILYVALRWCFSGESNTKYIAYILLFIVTIYEGYIGICQAFGLDYSNHSLFQITGTLFNPGPYGGLMAVLGSCAMSYLWLGYNDAKDIAAMPRSWLLYRPADATLLFAYVLAIPAVVACVIILPATLSRAAWVAVGIAMLTIVLIKLPVKQYLNKCWTRYKTCSALIVAAFMLFVVGGGYWAYTIKQGSADGRLLMWKIDSNIILYNPLGVGLGHFAGAFGDSQASYFENKTHTEAEKLVAGCPEYGFNEFLEFGAETGIIGLILMLYIIVMAIREGQKHQDPFAYGLLAISVFALFSYPFSVLPLQVIFVVLLAGSVSQFPDIPDMDYVRPSKFKYKFTLALSVVALLFIGVRGYNYGEAYKQWQETRVWLSAERYDYLVEDGDKFYEDMKHDHRFLYDYGYALHKQGDYKKSNEILKRGTDISSDPMFYNIMGKNYQAMGNNFYAESFFTKAHNMIPSRIYPLYLLTKMYQESGQIDKARNTANKALIMTIKVESEQTDELKQELQEILKQ